MMFVWKDQKINEKEARVGPFLKKLILAKQENKRDTFKRDRMLVYRKMLNTLNQLAFTKSSKYFQVYYEAQS